MNATIETTTSLSEDELSAVCAAASGMRNAETLDNVENELRAWFGGSTNWLVYRGGSHVALIHKWTNGSARVLMVAEEPVAEKPAKQFSPSTRYNHYTNAVQSRFLDRE